MATSSILTADDIDGSCVEESGTCGTHDDSSRDDDWQWNDNDTGSDDGGYDPEVELENAAIRAYNRGNKLLFEYGNAAGAVDAYTEALNTHPSFVTPWKNLGVAYFRLGMYSDALAAYANACSYGDTEACQARADLLDGMVAQGEQEQRQHMESSVVDLIDGEDYREAVDTLEDWLAVYPDDGWAWLALGHSLEMLAWENYGSGLFLDETKEAFRRSCEAGETRACDRYRDFVNELSELETLRVEPQVIAPPPPKESEPVEEETASVDADLATEAGLPSRVLDSVSPKAELILDALTVGDGDWWRSIQYLEGLQEQHPRSRYVSQALSYVRGVSIAQRATDDLASADHNELSPAEFDMLLGSDPLPTRNDPDGQLDAELRQALMGSDYLVDADSQSVGAQVLNALVEKELNDMTHLYRQEFFDFYAGKGMEAVGERDYGTASAEFWKLAEHFPDDPNWADIAAYFEGVLVAFQRGRQ